MKKLILVVLLEMFFIGGCINLYVTKEEWEHMKENHKENIPVEKVN